MNFALPDTNPPSSATALTGAGAAARCVTSRVQGGKFE